MPPTDETPNIASGLLYGVWEGDSKIVIGIDIGATQSGVVFTFLQKHANKNIHRITHWPGQHGAGSQGKIPTQVWYDTDGKATLFGAEATTYEAEDQAEDEHWSLAKHFKLHMHPPDMVARHDLQLDPLPEDVSLQTIYSDFLGYLFKHTKESFESRIADGPSIWNQYHSTMEIAIAHPNGWGLRQQAFLRNAAVAAGFATESTSRKNIKFVTEAEASVHYCMYNTNLGNRLQVGAKFVVCDAGGSTVDTTVYSVIETSPTLEMEEAKASACIQSGGIFVDGFAAKGIRTILDRASLDPQDLEDYVARGIKNFESSAKRNFTGAEANIMIEVADKRVSSAECIRRGKMNFPGTVIKSFFDPCVEAITESVGQQIDGMGVSYLILVGGFGDNKYLRNQLENKYGHAGCQVILTNETGSKAVADGALIWNMMNSTSSSGEPTNHNHLVVGRAPRLSYGLQAARRYSPFISKYRGRQVVTDCSGYPFVRGLWSQVAAKGITLRSNEVTRESYHRDYPTATPILSDVETTILSYSGNGNPTWAVDSDDNLNSGFKTVCVVVADLSGLRGALVPNSGMLNNIYWKLEYDVCIRFGGTELEAYLEWKENGVTCRGEASLILEDA